MPDFNEIAHTPLFIWDPVSGVCGERRSALTQTIDLAPTLLAFFGRPIPPDMRGRSLLPVIRENAAAHDYALFGYFNGPINITDGRYVYMRARVDDAVQMHRYTMMPTAMDNRLPVEQLRQAELAPPFPFTKDCPKRSDQAAQNRKLPRGAGRLYDLAAGRNGHSRSKKGETEARCSAPWGGCSRKTMRPKRFTRRTAFRIRRNKLYLRIEILRNYVNLKARRCRYAGKLQRRQCNRFNKEGVCKWSF